jgi:DNA-directed RNA polymerase subunit F
MLGENSGSELMRYFLLSCSTRNQIILIIGATIISALLIAKIASLFFDFSELIGNTDLTSAIYQVLGTVYAILLTFTLWGVWQSYCIAESSVQSEANALLDLIHIFKLVPQWKYEYIKKTALEYLHVVIHKEWADLHKMTNEIINVQETHNSSAYQLMDVIGDIAPQGERELVIYGHMLTLFGQWLDARRTRLLIAQGNKAKALWPILLMGAFVLFAFHGLFVAKSIGIWLMLLIGTALIIGLAFYLIFTLDSPFIGSPSIDPEPFHLVANVLKREVDKKS